MAFRRLLVCVSALVLFGCPGEEDAPNVPENPTYDPDVKAILDASCLSCHDVPPATGAPDYMRLDQYEDTPGPPNTTFGAGFMCCVIKQRAVDHNPSQMPPPPNPPLGAADSEIIRRWAAQGCRNLPAEPIGTPCP